MNCRCGEPATTSCYLCKAPLCGWHKGAQPVTVAFVGFTRLRLEPSCFPNCTSNFGKPEKEEPLKVTKGFAPTQPEAEA